MRRRAAKSISPFSAGTGLDTDAEGSDAGSSGDAYTTDRTDVDSDSSISDDCLSDEESSGMSELDEETDHPPEFYLSNAQEVDSSDIIEEDYAPSSTRQLDRIEARWFQYRKYVREPQTFDAITLGNMSSFFKWIMKQRHGQNGRRLRGTKISTSLETYWKQFRLVHERATGRKIDGQTNRQMHKVLRSIAKESGLSSEKRDKPAMDVEDVREVLQTTLTTTNMKYKIGRHRILTCLFIQGAFITANRPGALLHLQYKHIRVTIMRDPEGGPHRILLEFTFEFTKTFLGSKESNTFPIPEIIFDPSLIFSPHVILLGLMFADGAFRARSLEKPEDLSKLDIRPGCNSLQVPIDPTMADTYVFRSCTRTPYGWEVSEDILRDSTLRPWMKRNGEIAGFLQVARPYCLRYGSGNAFDENGNVSDALRNMIMQHADTRTFLNHYLRRTVGVDTQAIVRKLKPQDELIRAACRMSRWIDPERPWKLTPEQSLSVNDDPYIVRLIRRRDKHKRKLSQVEKCKSLGRKINNEKQRLRHALLIKIRKDWDSEQAVRDIEDQLAGLKFSEKVTTTLESSHDRTPEHNQLIKSILSLPGSTYSEEAGRRNAAINAVSVYCKIEEGHNRRQTISAKRFTRIKDEEEDKCSPTDPYIKAVEAAKLSVYRDKRPTICFLCLGNEQLSVDQRIYKFSSSTDLSRHFKRKHLKHMKPADRAECRVCMLPLEHKMHLQNHALKVHGTVS